MLSLILGFVTGLAGPISAITHKIADLKIKQAEAKSNVEIAKVNQEVEEAHDRKAILVAEAGHRLSAAINSSTRLLLTLGPAAILLKIFLWDKVIGSFYNCAGAYGTSFGCESFLTDKLDTNLWMVITAVIAFYFAYDIAARLKK